MTKEEIFDCLPLKEAQVLEIGKGDNFESAKELAFSIKEKLGAGVLFADGINERVTFISASEEEHILKLLVDMVDMVRGDISSSKAYTSFKDVDRLLEEGFDPEIHSRDYIISKIKELLN